MPSVMIYIRQADMDKWTAIENKSKWLHERLNNTVFKDRRYEVKQVEPKLTPPEESA